MIIDKKNLSTINNSNISSKKSMGKSLRRQILHKNLNKYKNEIENLKIKKEQKNNKEKTNTEIEQKIEKKPEQKNKKYKIQEKRGEIERRKDHRQQDISKNNNKIIKPTKIENIRTKNIAKSHEKIINLRPQSEIISRNITKHLVKPQTENIKNETRDIYMGTIMGSQNQEQDGGASYLSIARSDYKKPRGPSKQDQLTLEQIRTKLRGHRELKTMTEKSMLKYLQPFRVWVRYYDTKKEKFRVGGLLMKVDYPNYATLVNTKNNISWSIQLNDNIIYIPETAVETAKQKMREIQKQQTETRDPRTETRDETLSTNETRNSRREDLIKDKLYDLFMKGKLKIVK